MEYLKALVVEQINRGRRLKKLIPHPLQYVELERLADTCIRVIDNNIEILGVIFRTLENGCDIREAFRRFRNCLREIEWIEYFGISALYYQTKEIGYLNKLIFKIHQEVNLPLVPPSVACISTEHYYYHGFTNVIFVPIGESEFLLHLPDFFHELGHAVLFKRDETNLQHIKSTFNKATNLIAKHYQEVHQRKERETGPEAIIWIIRHIHSQWSDWIEEFFSDLFALYTLGPAYAWSHLHLTLKRSSNIYRFSKYLPLGHPSDDARMKLLNIGLELLEFKECSEKIMKEWKNMPLSVVAKPIPEYQYAYPDDLMNELAKLFLKGLADSNFVIIQPERLQKLGNDSIVKLLNDAWTMFWQNPDNYRSWEEGKIQDIKKSFSLINDTKQ